MTFYSLFYQAFAVFDRNKDGYVDANELRYALCTYGEAMTKEEADEVGCDVVLTSETSVIHFDAYTSG